MKTSLAIIQFIWVLKAETFNQAQKIFSVLASFVDVSLHLQTSLCYRITMLKTTKQGPSPQEDFVLHGRKDPAHRSLQTTPKITEAEVQARHKVFSISSFFQCLMLRSFRKQFSHFNEMLSTSPALFNKQSRWWWWCWEATDFNKTISLAISLWGQEVLVTPWLKGVGVTELLFWKHILFIWKKMFSPSWMLTPTLHWTSSSQEVHQITYSLYFGTV